MPELAQVLDRLCAVSRRRRAEGRGRIDWPDALDPTAWTFSPELISLYGTEVRERMPDAQRRRLSFFETVNFFSLNIQGETILVEDLSRRLRSPGLEDLTPYLSHFLYDESRHMAWFGGFCKRFAGKVYPDRKLAFPRDYAPGEEDLLFFARVLIFEEIVDGFNVQLARDERLPRVVRQINRLHHQDEARHLAFGRLVVKQLFERHAPAWSPETLKGVRDYLQAYVDATWREYFSPDAYGNAGISDPLAVTRAALADPVCRERRDRVTGAALRSLREAGVLKGVT